MRKCKICGNSLNTGSQIKIRLGVICPNCYEKLPNCAKENIGQLTSGQIRKLHSLFQAPHSTFWCTLGNLRLGEESILFSGKEIQLKDLKSFRFQFHPTGFYEDKAGGKGTVVIETKNPHIYLEDFYSDGFHAIGYHIQGKSIVYHYTDFCMELTDAIQSALDHEVYNLSDLHEKWKKKKAKKRKEKDSSKQQGSSKQQNKESEKQGFGEKEDQQKRPHSSQADSEWKHAMDLFSVTMPFKKEDLKEKRNCLLKQYHPDCPGGSDEKCKEINLAYQLLMRYAEE